MSGNARWQLSFWPVVAFGCTLPMLVSLGIWQTKRGFEKQEIYREFAEAEVVDAIDVGTLTPAEVNALPDYTVVKAQGRYLQERSFLLDNMSHQGRPGHHVLTPFQAGDAAYVIIVDRGWRAGIGGAAERIPPVPVDEVQGRLAPFPRPGLELDNKPVASGEWPRVVQFPDADELADQLKRRVVSRRLLLSPQAQEGFVREWNPPGIPPVRHFGYAFQWFGLAAALIVTFILMARPRRLEDGKE